MRDITHSMAHYLLTIHKLKEIKGYARVTDIAKELSLTKGSVSTAINNLKKKNLVLEENDSKFLTLSQEGHLVVHRVLSSRKLIYHFLLDFLKVPEDDALHDACVIEHLVSEKTIECFFNFMKEHQNDEPDNDLDLQKFLTVYDFVRTQSSRDKY